MVAAREHEEEEVTDWLTTPFTESYARTKIRAWVLRESCRWIRAPIPENEPARLTSLRALDLLDTEPEERFDRITRVATASSAVIARATKSHWKQTIIGLAITAYAVSQHRKQTIIKVYAERQRGMAARGAAAAVLDDL